MELFSLLGTIAIDNTQAERAIRQTADSANESADETSDAFAKIGSVASNIAKGIGLAGVAIGGAWLATIESTREYRKEMGLLESAFETAGYSSEVAKDTYSELNAVLGDSGQAIEAAQHLAKIADNEKDLNTWTTIATGVFSEFGEAIPIESLAEASLETQKSGVLTGALVDALVWAGHSEEEFQEKLDACTTEQERQKLIMDTLNGTYGEAAEQYRATNKDVMDAEKANQRLADAFAELGAVGEPILTKIKEKVAEFIQVAVPKIQEFIDKLKDCVNWIKENESTIQMWVGVILGAMTAIGTFLLILNWGTIMTTAANAIKVVRTAILGMNAAMLANPVGLIVALIVGLVATFIYLWNNVDGFKKFWVDTWEKVQKKTKDVTTNIKKFFSDTYKGIKNTFSNIGSWFGDKFRSAWTSIKNAFSNWGSFFGGLWTSIKSKFSSIGTSLGTAMSNAVKNGMNKVLSKIESSINKGIGLINSAIRLANKLPGLDVGTVAKISLPRLATGGVLEKGQIGLLEGSGAEAVVPLEKNTQWIDKVSEQFEKRLMHKDDNLSNQDLIRRMDRVIQLLEQGKEVYLDSGVLVGELSSGIDSRLGNMYKHVIRGNTR